ncbi:LLM class F420-dependent oxidoreductase [Streptomyces clavuligerus]|uniref:Peptidase E n=2 Tax=Streptomyces clavuligerus TaxID=1901 RepID=E2PUK4_STRCL|nr:LLM class F420-dependent oxidoreductase [Streptomyces clavuligerus]AXU14031.1 TIGR03619 family F420-dependent LLM class oxidoreductase [Streptomyces clavuligerus]EFG07783.1 peptidase E [Streptomyces clavuligerus]QCS06804.1 TIGR03619 family F420-dependent LLM class oxidoreductase [Streptomyces clavuligerus]QPJ93842.1 TIGR03619 family F420-dependent LLM class oxidoreductase [Streptomyces clavuligerus]
MKIMLVGIALPQYGSQARAESIAPFARDAEAAGFDTLWAGDRALAPVAPGTLYPGCTPDRPYPPEFTTFLDPLAVLTVAATATVRARLGTSTLIAPLHPPLLLARSLTSLDRISGGRLDVGLGIGWLREEYTAVGADFSRRGEQLDEILDLLHGIWTRDPFRHEGKRWTVPEARIGLRPVQTPGPPVHLGGTSEAALRRVGRRADGWAGVVLPPEYAAHLWDTARRAARDAGRDPDALRRTLRYNVPPGTPAESIAEVLRTVRDSGADGCFPDLHRAVREPDEALETGIRALQLLREG